MQSENSGSLYPDKALEKKLSNDILASVGEANGFLPTISYFCKHYGVSHRKMKSVLDKLAASGLIERFGRKYRLCLSTKPLSRSIILCFIEPYTFDQFSRFHSGLKDFILSFEQECASRNVRVRFVAYNSKEDLFPQKNFSLSSLGNRESVLGCVFRTMFMTTAENIYKRTLTIAAKKIPVAILDDVGVIEDFAQKNLGTKTHQFRSAFTKQCGIGVGQYILACGHRKAAYVSLYHSQEWSIHRLNGLRSAFSMQGNDGDLIEFVDTSRNYVRDFPDHDKKTIENLNEQLQNVTSLSNEIRIASIKEDIIRDTEWTVAFTIQQEKIDKIIDRIIHTTQCTVIIVSNDSQAIQVLRSLKNRGLDVPKDISVIGFDNTTESTIEGLTTWDFNQQETSRAVLNAFLSPSRTKSSLGPYDIDGFIVERESVRKI